MLNKFINIRVSLRLLIAVFPGVCFAMFFHNEIWFLVSFFAACGIIPYGSSHSNKTILLISVTLIFMLSIITAMLISSHQITFIIFICFAVTAIGFLDTNNKQFKSIGSWFLIGIIYTGFKLHSSIDSISRITMMQVYIASIMSCLPAFLIKEKHTIELNFKLKFRKFDIPDYLKYLLPIAIVLVLWQTYSFSKPEWLLWSSLSVVSLELSSSSKKMRDRIVGGIIGIALGVAIVSFLPITDYNSYAYPNRLGFLYPSLLATAQFRGAENLNIVPLAIRIGLPICYIGIIISLRLFKTYIYGFTMRCTLIVLAAGPAWHLIGIARITNVVIGGTIGYICVLVLCLIKHKMTEYAQNAPGGIVPKNQ
jgi:hypothetical protein